MPTRQKHKQKEGDIMALAAISSVLSTGAVGLVVLGIIVLIVRSMWKKKKAGGPADVPAAAVPIAVA